MERSFLRRAETYFLVQTLCKQSWRLVWRASSLPAMVTIAGGRGDGLPGRRPGYPVNDIRQIETCDDD